MIAKDTLRDLAYRIHDVNCNQKYDKTLPYSFHLGCVEKQFDKFKHLIPKGYVENPDNSFSATENNEFIVNIAIYGHDLIEDCGISYNDMIELFELSNYIATKRLAEIVYLCSEDKGRNRAERKSERWYKELATDKLAVFVKLCDIIANTKYSLLQNSNMFDKYRTEYYDKVKPFLYCEEYEEMFDYLEKLYEL